MILEEFDKTARENLARADESMRSADLDDGMGYLRTANSAVYIMRFVGGIRVSNDELRVLSPYPPLLQRIVPGYVEQDLEHFGMTKWDIPDLHERIDNFYRKKGYTTDALNSDSSLICWYGDLIRDAQRGCFIDAQEMKDSIDSHVQGIPWFLGEGDLGKGLPKPLVSEEATKAVVDYAREHGEDGLEFWLQKAEDHVNNGYMTYPTEIPHSAREKISSYTDALAVPFPEERFQQILKVNARNVALDRIRVLQRVKPEMISDDVNYRREWLEREVCEAKEYAKQADLGLLYRVKLSRARKEAEKRLLTA